MRRSGMTTVELLTRGVPVLYILYFLRYARYAIWRYMAMYSYGLYGLWCLCEAASMAMYYV